MAIRKTSCHWMSPGSCWAVLLFLAIWSSSCGSGSGAGLDRTVGPAFVFGQESVPEIQLTPAAGWAGLLEAYLGKGGTAYVEAGFAFNQSMLDSIGLRIREDPDGGKGTPRKKYNLKLNFDYFGGPRFSKMDKLLLSVERPDPTMLREALAARMFGEMGVPCPRIDFAVVTVGGEALGLYVTKQPVDKRFLKDRFGTASSADDGNLYECEPPGCLLEWAGEGKESYLDETCPEEGGCGLVLITNEFDSTSNDYFDLVDFLNVLGNMPDEAFAVEIQKVFDVDTFLRYLAVAVAIGDHESYLGQGQDFYLYRRPDTGRFMYIPWDHNRTYGAKKCKDSNESTGAEVGNPVCGSKPRPLVTRLLEVDEFRSLYLTYLGEVVDNYLTVQVQEQWIMELDARISGVLETDPNRSFTMKEYETALSTEPSDGDPANLLEFVQDRAAYLQQELP